MKFWWHRYFTCLPQNREHVKELKISPYYTRAFARLQRHNLMSVQNFRATLGQKKLPPKNKSAMYGQKWTRGCFHLRSSNNFWFSLNNHKPLGILGDILFISCSDEVMGSGRVKTGIRPGTERHLSIPRSVPKSRRLMPVLDL